MWWSVWKERNRRAFEGVDCVKGFDILKNKWVRTRKFWMLGHPTVVIENFFENLSLDDCDVNYLYIGCTPLMPFNLLFILFIFKKIYIFFPILPFSSPSQ